MAETKAPAAGRFRLVFATAAGREAGVRSIRWGTAAETVAVGYCYPVDPELRAPDGPRLHAVLCDQPRGTSPVFGSDLLAGNDEDLLAKLAARLEEKGRWWN